MFEEGVLADLSKLRHGYERWLSGDNFEAAGGQLRTLALES